MARKTFADGWSAAIKHLQQINTKAVEEGKKYAHLNDEHRDEWMRSTRPSYVILIEGEYMPHDLKNLVHDAGFKAGVRMAEEHARHVGMILDRQRAGAPEPVVDPDDIEPEGDSGDYE